MQEILGDPSTVYLQLSQGKNVKNVMSHESVHVVGGGPYWASSHALRRDDPRWRKVGTA